MARSILLPGLIAMAVVAMAAAETLRYQGGSGAPESVQTELTYTLTLSGPPELTTQLIKGNPALAIQQLRATQRVRRVVVAADGGAIRVAIAVETARVEGRTQDKPIQFEFDPARPAAVSGHDPLRQFSAVVSMAPRRYTLEPTGDYRLGELSADDQAEPRGVILDAPVQLPDFQVDVGSQWKDEWTGAGRKKDGAAFRYRQTARLEEMTSGASPRARIAFSTSGTLQAAPDKSLQEETTLDAKGFIALDVRTGRVKAVNSGGTITTAVKSAGLKVVVEYTSKYDMP